HGGAEHIGGRSRRESSGGHIAGKNELVARASEAIATSAFANCGLGRYTLGAAMGQPRTKAPQQTGPFVPGQSSTQPVDVSPFPVAMHLQRGIEVREHFVYEFATLGVLALVDDRLLLAPVLLGGVGTRQ